MGYTFPGERVDLGGGRGWLDRPHAESILRIDRQIGHLLQITEAGRTWDEQNAHFQTFLRVGYPIALNPDTPSVHQQGGAIDSNEAQRILQIMEDHGWRRTVYRWVNGKWTLVEEWHFERFAELDKHRNDSTPASTGSGAATTNQSEEDEMSILIRIDGGTSFTLEPFRGIKAHANVMGARLALRGRNKTWPPAEGPDFERFRSDERNGELQCTRQHAEWLADVYGLAELLPFPAPGQTKRL